MTLTFPDLNRRTGPEARTRSIYPVGSHLLPALFGIGLIVLGLVAAPDAMAQSLGDMADDMATDLNQVPDLLEILFYIAGVVLIGVGIMRFKRHADHPQQASLGGATATLLVGVGLVLLPVIGSAVMESVGANQATTIEAPRLNN